MLLSEKHRKAVYGKPYARFDEGGLGFLSPTLPFPSHDHPLNGSLKKISQTKT